MTTLAPTGEPACSGPADAPRSTSEIDPVPAPRALRAARVDFDSIPREAWDRLAAANPWATPFSSWAFQRAWWDAYGGTAHDQTLVVCEPLSDANPNPTDDPIAIVPLMHRHEVEPTDAASATKIRHGDQADLTPVPATAKAVFFGASYHADYATILAAPEHLPAVARAVVDHLASEGSLLDPGHPTPWDVVDLRRLRCGDPTAEALTQAFGAREIEQGWTVDLEREDVCPVVTFPEGATFEDFLGTLDKKARHEIRRKLRRAEAAGEVRLTESANPLEDLEDFIDLHQRRWGEDGLFPPTPGGDASRVFLRRVFEESGRDGPIRLSFLTIGDRRIATGIHVQTATDWMFYNAGIEPEAKELSPGVVLAACYVQAAIEAGAKRFDFLRGDESYKYEWGSVDEPIQRLLVRRDETAAADAAWVRR